MSSKPVGLCEAPVQERVKKLEGILGVSLPYCATVIVTQNGIRATATDASGTTRVAEIDNSGDVFRTTELYEGTRPMTIFEYRYKKIDGCSELIRTPFCRDWNHIKQEGSVPLDKLARAKEFLRTDKPKVK